ncbi:MAG: hypothetical protein K2O12_02595 [Muribaculaceae bacterium]|nr:hypothetical protein [Muribaculaceae bacterium]
MNRIIFRSLLVIAILAGCVLPSCKTPATVAPEYASYQFEVECLGVNPDGSQTLRSWGKGKNKAEAIEQARQRAVEAVIFKGITSGGKDCDKRPVVTEVNAREKYRDYFNAFFSKGGAFNRYVSLNESRTSRIKAADSSQEAWSVVVIVDRNALQKRLADDNMISM